MTDDRIAYRLVRSRLRRYRLDVAGQRLQVHWPVIEAHLTFLIEPRQRVLQPVHVVTLRVILPGVRTAALGPVHCGMQRDDRLPEQVLELERLDQIRVPDQRTIADSHLSKGFDDCGKLLDTLLHRLARPEHGSMCL